MKNRVGRRGDNRPVEGGSKTLSILALERRYRAEQRRRGLKTRVLTLNLPPDVAARFDARCVERQISRTEGILELVRGESRMTEMAQ